MLKFVLGVSLSLFAVAPSPVMAAVNEVRTERTENIKTLRQNADAGEKSAVDTAPEIITEGVFSFVPFKASPDATHTASADASESADVMETSSEPSTESPAPLAVNAEGITPKNNLVSTTKLRHVEVAPDAVQRPLVAAGMPKIPRTHKPPATQREAKRLEHFDQIWRQFKRQKIEELGQPTDSPPQTKQEQPETLESETKDVDEREKTPSVSNEETLENPAASSQHKPEPATKPQPSKTQTEIPAAEEPKAETSVSLGISGIGGEDAALEAALGFTQDGFEVNATSTSSLNGKVPVVDLESTFPISETTSLRVAANDVTSKETTFDVGVETQLLPQLSLNTTFENIDDARVNLEAAWQASDTVSVTSSISDITAEKVVDIEASYTRPNEAFSVTARANDALRPAQLTFDLEAAYKISRWTKASLRLENLGNPTVGVGTEVKLNRSTSLNLSAEDIFGNQTYGGEFRFSF